MFLDHPVLYCNCENEFKLKSASKQCFFLEAYASFADYKIVKAAKTPPTTEHWQRAYDEHIIVIIVKRFL